MTMMKTDYCKQLEERINELEEQLEDLEQADVIIDILKSEETLNNTYLYGHQYGRKAAIFEIDKSEVCEPDYKTRVRFARDVRMSPDKHKRIKRAFDYFGIPYKEKIIDSSEPPF